MKLEAVVPLVVLMLLVFTIPDPSLLRVADAQPATARIVYRNVPSGEDAVAALRNGEIDVYQSTISRATAIGLGDSDPDMMFWESRGLRYDFLLNAAPDPSGLNPFSLSEVRFALNYMTKWKFHAETTLGGFALPMETYVNPMFPEYPVISDLVWRHNFRYDLEYADFLVTEAMEQAGAVKVGGQWHFNDSPVVVRGIARIEDERLTVGRDFATQLQALGFMVELAELPASQAIPMVYFDDPNSFDWHFYTEGWATSQPNRYITFEPGFFGGSSQLEFQVTPGYTNAEVDRLNERLSQDLLAEEREAVLRELTDLVIRESVRLFGLTATLVHASSRDVQGITEDLWRGLGNPYVGREIFVPGRDVVNIGIPFTRLEFYIWNAYSPVFGESAVVRGLTVDPRIERHPFTGDVLPFRSEYTVLTAGPAGVLEVPPQAVMWDTSSDNWQSVGPGLTATSRVDLDYSLYTQAEWHHGIGISLADVLYGLASALELAFDPEKASLEPTLSRTWGDRLAPLKAIEVVNPDTLRVYADVWHFDTDELAMQAAEAAPWIGLPWELVAAQNELVFGQQSFAFDEGTAQNAGIPWLDLADEAHADEVSQVITSFQTSEFFPSGYFTVDGIGYETSSNAQARYQAAVLWESQRGILWIGDGPFQLEALDRINGVLELLAYSDPGYPFSPGDWSFPPGQLPIQIRGSSSADTVTIDVGFVEVCSPTCVSFSYDPAGRDFFLVDLGPGDDTLVINDAVGDDWYLVFGHGGNDDITVQDGDGKDEYVIQTGLGSDAVAIGDQAGVNAYRVFGGEGNDRFEIVDRLGDDAYTAMGQEGLDQLIVRDGDGGDAYALSGGGESDLFDLVDGLGNDDYKLFAGPGDDSASVVDSPTTDTYLLHGGDDQDSLTLDDVTPADADTISQISWENVQFPPADTVLEGLSQPLIVDIDAAGRIYFTEVQLSPDGFAGVLKRYDPRRDSVEVLVSHDGLFIRNVATDPGGNLYYQTDEVAGCFTGGCFLNRLKRGEAEPEVLYVATTTRIADLAVDQKGNLYFTEEVRKFVDDVLVISPPSKLFFVPHDSSEAMQLLELEGIAPQPLLVHPHPRVGVLFAANLDDCVCILQFRDGVVDRVLERSPDQFGALAYMALGRDGSLYYLYRQRSDIIPPVELPMFGYLEVGRLDLPSLLGGGDPEILVADAFDEALLVYYGGLPWLGAGASDEVFFTILFFRENWIAGDWSESLFRLDISTGAYEPIASSFGVSEGLTFVIDARGNVYYSMFISGVIVRA